MPTFNEISSKIQRAFQSLKIIKTKDEYINWLGFANAGMLNQGNLYCFEYAIEHITSSNPILEIGSFCGLSTNAISYFAQKHNRRNKFITSDKWLFEGAETETNIPNSNLSYSEYRDYIKESYIRNITFFSKVNLPYTVEELSDDFFELWFKEETVKDVLNREVKLGGKISFCYIDGNHTYEYAKRDFENTDKYLEVGGFILFDDSFDGSPFGCSQLMKEIKKNLNYKLVIKNPNYLFQKVSEA